MNHHLAIHNVAKRVDWLCKHRFSWMASTFTPLQISLYLNFKNSNITNITIAISDNYCCNKIKLVFSFNNNSVFDSRHINMMSLLCTHVIYFSISQTSWNKRRQSCYYLGHAILERHAYQVSSCRLIFCGTGPWVWKVRGKWLGSLLFDNSLLILMLEMILVLFTSTGLLEGSKSSGK